MCWPKQGQQAAFRRGSHGSNEFALWDLVLAGWLCRALVDLTPASRPELSKMTSQSSLSSARKVWGVAFDVGMLRGARKRHGHNGDCNHGIFRQILNYTCTLVIKVEPQVKQTYCRCDCNWKLCIRLLHKMFKNALNQFMKSTIRCSACGTESPAAQLVELMAKRKTIQLMVWRLAERNV